jgi:hypothetical protein
MVNLEWIDASGGVTGLMDGVNTWTMWGGKGEMMPGYALNEVQPAGMDGTRINSMFAKPREINIPLLIKDSSKSLLETRMRSMARAMDPKRGDGTLRITDESGKQRKLVCRYKDGFGGDLSQSNAGVNWRKLILTFHGADPAWYGDVFGKTLPSGAVASWFPIFPIMLSSSSIFGYMTVVNNGDLECWPIFTFVGPGTNPGMVNQTTGKWFATALVMGVGDVLVIDTRPGFKTVTYNGASRFDLLGLASNLWSLASGNNVVNALFASTSMASQITFTYTERWLTA